MTLVPFNSAWVIPPVPLSRPTARAGDLRRCLAGARRGLDDADVAGRDAEEAVGVAGLAGEGRRGLGRAHQKGRTVRRRRNVDVVVLDAGAVAVAPRPAHGEARRVLDRRQRSTLLVGRASSIVTGPAWSGRCPGWGRRRSPGRWRSAALTSKTMSATLRICVPVARPAFGEISVADVALAAAGAVLGREEAGQHVGRQLRGRIDRLEGDGQLAGREVEARR